MRDCRGSQLASWKNDSLKTVRNIPLQSYRIQGSRRTESRPSSLLEQLRKRFFPAASRSTRPDDVLTGAVLVPVRNARPDVVSFWLVSAEDVPESVTSCDCEFGYNLVELHELD
jgi:hypothetical protein